MAPKNQLKSVAPKVNKSNSETAPAKKRVAIVPSTQARGAARADENIHPQLPWIERTPRWKALAIVCSIAIAMLAFSFSMHQSAEQARGRTEAPRATGRLPPWVAEEKVNPPAVYRVWPNSSLPRPRRDDFASQGLPCSSAVSVEDDVYTRCVPPKQRCSRLVVDNFIEDRDAHEIVQGMCGLIREIGGGGGSGPVSLVELHQGVVSKHDKFVGLHFALRNFRTQSKPLPFTVTDAERYLAVVKKIHRFVSEFMFCEQFPCASDAERHSAREKGLHSLFVAPPSFFSRIGTKPAVTMNDEYWHMHEDRIQYGSFAITTLLYLNTAQSNELDTFEGGSFEFGGQFPASVYPRRGRLSLFTSGSENPHWVAPVREGLRYALTTAFTCDRTVGATLAHDGEGSFLRALLDSL